MISSINNASAYRPATATTRSGSYTEPPQAALHPGETLSISEQATQELERERARQRMDALVDEDPQFAAQMAKNTAYGYDLVEVKLTATPNELAASTQKAREMTPQIEAVRRQRIALYESEIAKGTPPAKIYHMLQDATRNLPGSYKQATGLGYLDNTPNQAADASPPPQGVGLTTLPPLLLPTRENVLKLSAALADELKSLFEQAGIESQPPIEFSVDPYSAKVSVKGDRPDAEKIADLIQQHPDIEQQIRNVAALSSHAVAMERALEADKAYRAAQTAEEIKRVVAQYADVYRGETKVTEFSMAFDGTTIQVNADGAAWLSSQKA